MHELLKLGGLVQAELVDSDLLLLSLYVVVLLILGASGKALPRQGAAQKVQKHVTDGLEVVSAGLLVADVSVERRVSSSACQIFAFFEWNVFTFRIFEAFGESEVDNVDVILGCFCGANQEVVWLDVSVNNAFLVHFLDAQDLN